MFDFFSIAFSVAMYVLQALGMYTIAKRRGIPYAWLAWVPVGSLWILGSISDDYKAKIRGKRCFKRVILPILVVLTLVLCVAVLTTVYEQVIAPVLEVVSMDELYAIYEGQLGDSVSHMYEPVQDEAMEALEEKLNAAFSEEQAEQMMEALLPMMLLSVVLTVTSLVGIVLEYICMYDLFASCDPGSKLLYLLLSILFGVQAVIIFLCRNKDLGMVPPNPGLPGGFDPQMPRWSE